MCLLPTWVRGFGEGQALVASMGRESTNSPDFCVTALLLQGLFLGCIAQRLRLTEIIISVFLSLGTGCTVRRSLEFPKSAWSQPFVFTEHPRIIYRPNLAGCRVRSRSCNQRASHYASRAFIC